MHNNLYQKAPYQKLKDLIDEGKQFTHTQDDASKVRVVFVYADRDVVYTSKHRIIDSGDPEYSGSDCEDFESNYIQNSGTKNLFDVDGNLRSSDQPRVGTSLTIMTHNFADPCTWYENSVRITSGSIAQINSGDFNNYNLGYENIIDLTHGRVTFEHRVEGDYDVEVHVSGQTLTSGFTTNYESGIITFDSPLAEGDNPTASFSYATDSVFSIVPNAGTKIKIMNVESQFSRSINFSYPYVRFDAWAYNPYDLPNKVLAKPAIYKDIKDWLNESNNTMTKVIPKFGTLTDEVIVFAWQYPASKVLESAKGIEMRAFTEDPNTGSKNVPMKAMDGSTIDIATATFYCIVEEED